MNCDVLIAGGGPAGMTAAVYAGRAGWKTVLLDPMGGGGQAGSTDTIHNYPGFPGGVSGMRLMELMAEQATDFGAEIKYEEVRDVKAKDGLFEVKCDDEDFLAKTVIYATGTSPNKLGVPGEDKFIGRGISFCATCDGALFRDKVVAVVGGGDSALTEALFVARFAKKVLLIHRRDEFRAGLAAVNRISAEPKIELVLSSQVVEVKGDLTVEAIAVKDVKGGDVRSVPVDGLFLYVGSTPNTAPVKNLLTLTPGGYLVANEDMTTGVPGLFAAGDVRAKPLRQVATAVSDGALAAWSAETYLLEYAARDAK